MTTDLPTIGIIVPALAGGGGVPAVADFLCTQLERSGRFRVQVFSLATSRRDADSSQLLAPATWAGRPRTSRGSWRGRPFTHVGCQFAELEFRRYRRRPALSKAVAECDLLQVVAGSPAQALPLVGLGKPVALQVATLVAVERRSATQQGSPASRFARRMMTAVVSRMESEAIARVDAVFVENAWMETWARHAAGRSGARIVMATPGVDARRFHPRGERAAALVEPRVLFVGRLSDPRKNVAMLCETLARLHATGRRVPKATLAGHGELPAAAAAALASLPEPLRPEIVLRPDDERLAALYRDAACLALPSDEEGFGMVVIEAMASGVPVVATRCGGPEGIVTDGSDGLLTPRGDVDEFASRLAQLCEDRAANLAMGQRARETVLRRFAADVAIEPFLRTYDALLLDRGRGGVGASRRELACSASSTP